MEAQLLKQLMSTHVLEHLIQKPAAFRFDF